MSRAALLELIHARIGLDPATLGERVIDDACSDARRALAVADDVSLYRRVLHDSEAFAAVTESFVVPESWFFRAAEQFEDLVRFARQQSTRRPLRVLSLPSASGEEAYSAVICLLDAGLSAAEIDVLGIDVSRQAVARAQAGVYRRSALRGQSMPGGWIEERADGLLEVDAGVRRCARFRVGNALDPQLLCAEDRFDVMFCRNLLIYLHPQARLQLVSTLLESLATPGLVLAGQAEVLSTLNPAFGPYEGGCPLSFVRRAPAPAVQPRVAATPAAPRRRSSESGAAPVAAPTARVAPAAVVSIKEEPLVIAQRLADGGQLADARTALLTHLAAQPADVAGLFLLGLLESAAGDAEAAERAFAKVLYLDRNHLAAIEQRIGLAERRGQAGQARELRARAARLRQKLPVQP
jgi:chemotaxis protein methyltransferase WspC